MNNKPIGIFDSGVGGLTVAKCIIESMPDEDIIYLGDTANVPYGTRPKEEIAQLVLNDVKFLSSFDLKAIVIACNTADAAAREKVEEMYSLPVFGIIEPTSEKAALTTKNGKIGIIATNATIDSSSYERNIKRFKPDAEVFGVACPKLVPLIEQGKFRKGDTEIEEALKEYLIPLKAQGIDTLILGCTHYPMLTEIAAEILPEVQLISSSAAEAEALKSSLESNGMLNGKSGSERKFFVSGDKETFEKTAEIFMGNLGGTVEHVNIQ